MTWWLDNQVMKMIFTFQGFTLHEVKVVALFEDSVLETPAEALEVPVVDVEHVALHGGRETPEDLLPTSRCRFALYTLHRSLS